jgi:tetratricopeptide (TPR) repeat protein
MNQIIAINLLEKNKDYYAISDYLTYMSDIYIKQNKPDKALEYASRSLKLAQKYGLKKQISISNENYQNCTRNLGTMKRPYSFTKIYCLQRQQRVSKLFKSSRHRTNYEIAQKLEVDLLNQQKQIKRQY